MNQNVGTALIIIDLQKNILEGLGGNRPKETAEALTATARRVADLLAHARAAQIPVIFVQHSGGRGHRLEPNTPGWEIREEVAPASSEVVIHKRACDSFFETGLDAELKRLNISRLIIAGCMTQYCIDTTVRRAVSVGYDVILAADGHMTADSGGLRFEQIIAHHNHLLDGFDAGEHSVQVMTIEEIANKSGIRAACVTEKSTVDLV